MIMEQKNEILLTISIAAYNVEKYIRKALDSCIVSLEKQKYLEVIIVNDGSTDHTHEIAIQYQKDYPHLFRVIDKINAGYGSTINAALVEANGRYFKLLDGDDWYNKEVLECFLDILEASDADVIFTNYARINDNNSQVTIVRYGEAKENTLYNFGAGQTLTWAMHGIAVKTDILLNNKIKITEKCFYTDAEYVLYIMRYIRTYKCFDMTLYQYRVGNNGQSVSRAGLIKHRLDAKKTLVKQLSIYDDVTDKVLKEEMGKYIAISTIFTLYGYVLNGYNKKSKKEMIELDIWIKDNYPIIYNNMNKSTALAILRRTNYSCYFIFWLDALRRFK